MDIYKPDVCVCVCVCFCTFLMMANLDLTANVPKSTPWSVILHSCTVDFMKQPLHLSSARVAASKEKKKGKTRAKMAGVISV